MKYLLVKKISPKDVRNTTEPTWFKPVSSSWNPVGLKSGMNSGSERNIWGFDGIIVEGEAYE